MAKRTMIPTREIHLPYTRCVEQRRKLIARIRTLKAQGRKSGSTYDHASVRVLLIMARRLTSARAKLLDNYYRAYYEENRIPESQQDHFKGRKAGRVT